MQRMLSPRPLQAIVRRDFQYNGTATMVLQPRISLHHYGYLCPMETASPTSCATLIFPDRDGGTPLALLALGRLPLAGATFAQKASSTCILDQRDQANRAMPSAPSEL